MASKTKLIDEAKTLFADTDEPALRIRYERLFGDFRRLLSEAEKVNDLLREELSGLRKKVDNLEGSLHTERDTNRAKDVQLEALKLEVLRFQRLETAKELEILRSKQKVLGGKRINPFNPEILSYVTQATLEKMVTDAVRDYNQGSRSSDVKGFKENLIIATNFERRFAIVVSRTEVEIFFLDEDKTLEKALRSPNLKTRINQVGE